MKTSGKQTYRILVVDDQPSVCKAIKMLLNFDGHEVQTVESGEAALACDYEVVGAAGWESPSGRSQPACS